MSGGCTINKYMELEELKYDLTVCKLADIKDIYPDDKFYFLGRTDEEISLVCRTENTPDNTIEREDGWRGFASAEFWIFLLQASCQGCPESLLRI